MLENVTSRRISPVARMSASGYVVLEMVSVGDGSTVASSWVEELSLGGIGLVVRVRVGYGGGCMHLKVEV